MGLKIVLLVRAAVLFLQRSIVLAERCDIVRDEVYASSLKLGVTKKKDAVSPYELREALSGAVASRCGVPLVRDMLVAAGGAQIFNGSLEEAAGATALSGDSAEYAFPLVENDIVNGFVFARFERVLFAEAQVPLIFAGPQVKSEAIGRELRLKERSGTTLSTRERLRIESEERQAEKAAADRQEREQESRAERAREQKERDRKEREEVERKEQRERQEAERRKIAVEQAAEKRRAAQEAAANTAEIKLDGWARRRSNHYEWLTAKFDQDKGPMGIAFDAQRNLPPAVVNAVNDRLSPAFRAGVRPGDQLVEVRWNQPNDDGDIEPLAINTTDFGPSQVRLTLLEAQYPRQLVFFRDLASIQDEALSAKKNPKHLLPDESDTKSFVLRILTPAVAHGSEFPLLSADWSPKISKYDCSQSWTLALADPVHGCTGTLSVSSDTTSVLALAARGTCTFVDKARALQKQNATAVLIHNNAPGASAPMPSGSVRTDDITVPVLGLPQKAGLLLAHILRWNYGLTAWIGPASHTCAHHTPAPPIPIRSTIMDEDAPLQFGQLELQCRDFHQRFKFVAAAFGPLATAEPFPAATTRPSHLCGLSGIERRLTGMAAIVRRGGGCGFGDKALIAQKLGAAAVIVLNHKGREPERMMADPAFRITIPAIMASDELEAAIDEMARDETCASHGTPLVRFVYDALPSS